MLVTIDLNWKNFKVNGNLVLSVLKNISSNVVGTSHNSKFQVHFDGEPSQEELELINEYWESINEESEEATSYISAVEASANELAANIALKESAKAKLAALGLSDAEIKAIIGV